MYCFKYGELQTSPRIEILAPFYPAVLRAYLMNLMLASLLGMHLV